MNYGDFTTGFEQGQEHEKQIMLEKIEGIKADIKEHQRTMMPVIPVQEVFEIIDKHIGSYADEN